MSCWVKQTCLCRRLLQWGGESWLLFPLLLTSLQTNFHPPSPFFFLHLGAKLKNLLFTHRPNTATKCNPLNCFSSLLGGGGGGGVGLCKVSLGLQAAYFLAPSQLHSTKNSLLIKKKKKIPNSPLCWCEEMGRSCDPGPAIVSEQNAEVIDSCKLMGTIFRQGLSHEGLAIPDMLSVL